MVERPLDRGAVRVRIQLQPVGDLDALDDQDAVLVLDLTSRLRGEPSFSGRDVTRLQRASERPRQSAGRRGDDVVECRRALGAAAALHAVVVGDLVMNAELDRLLGPGQVRAPERAGDALDSRPARVHDLAH
jgi:hypothetical protein